MGRGSNQPLELRDTNLQIEHAFVENQPGAVNPTNNFWSFDDNWQALGNGYLEPGAAVTREHTVIIDNSAHMIGVQIAAPASTLEVTVRYGPWDVVQVMTARPLGNGYEYRGCIRGPRYTLTIQNLPEIEGANGGRGFLSQLIVTIRNPTGKRISKISAGVEFGSSGPSPRREAYCQPSPNQFTIDDFVWEARL